MNITKTIIAAADLAKHIQSGETGWEIETFAYGWIGIRAASYCPHARTPLWGFEPVDETKLAVYSRPESTVTARRVDGAR